MQTYDEQIDMLSDNNFQTNTKHLSHNDKIQIISALLAGLANDAIFDEDTIRERIRVCLNIVEEFV